MDMPKEEAQTPEAPAQKEELFYRPYRVAVKSADGKRISLESGKLETRGVITFNEKPYRIVYLRSDQSYLTLEEMP